MPHAAAMVTDSLQVKGLVVMYGLPWLLTGAILAHELMHAWVAENNINCGRSDGDEMSAVGEGLAELLGFMWLEAQVTSGKLWPSLTALAG